MAIEITSPTNISQAKKYLKKKFTPLAGGTTLLLHRQKDIQLLDLSKLNLSTIKFQEKSVRLGAMTTISALLEEQNLNKIFGGLIPQALLTIGTTLNRNMITVGGNIVGIHPWSVLPGLLLLLDAKIKTIQKKSYPAKRFFSQLPKNILKNDLITEIEIPFIHKNSIGGWEKFSLTETDYPLVSVGALKLDKNIRLVAVGLTLLPQFFEVNPDNIPDEIGAIVLRVKINRDIRVSVEYKRQILEALFMDVIPKD
jgi:CO/xanthine dehydrogenase FAD-binding subunit